MTTPNFDNLLLQSLISRPRPRLRLRPPPPLSPDDLLFSDLLLNVHNSDSDYHNPPSSKTPLAREESNLEKEIIHTILTGQIEILKPNSGQAVTIGEHHICIGFQQDSGSAYRVWEWHGHIMLFDEESGYTPEYVYGNYFERIGDGKRELNRDVMKETEEDENEVDSANLGLKELIEIGESGGGRILHRHINANFGSPKFI